MAATSVAMFAMLALIYALHDLSDGQRLQEATLAANATAIAASLHQGGDPARLPLYRDHPDAYGFRVFDRPILATRRILASANTRWLPPIQVPAATASDPDGDRDRTAVGTDLLEGFTPPRNATSDAARKAGVALLVRRVSFPGRHFWIQVYMAGDPAWAAGGVIVSDLVSHVFVPGLLIIPPLTLAIFLTTRAALRPLRRLSEAANSVGAAVARGQGFASVPETGMAREFGDVAATINTILKKLDHSLQLQKQFTSDVAHELRTPLSVLLLEAAQLPDGEGRERVKSDLQDLGRLVNELLRFAQAEDVMAREALEIDVADIARKVVEDAVGEALGKQQSIELFCESTATHVRGNAALIEIAIRNLVGNAIKYSPAHTVISVYVTDGPMIMVDDRGPGISPEHRQRVFERFWRADGRSIVGAGVGLALVQRIAQLHDGSVRLEDRAGGGTRMVLNLEGAASLLALAGRGSRKRERTRLGLAAYN